MSLHRLKFGELLPGNSRDDRTHLRTHIFVLGENRPNIRLADIQKCHGILLRNIVTLMGALTAAMITVYLNLVGF